MTKPSKYLARPSDNAHSDFEASPFYGKTAEGRLVVFIASSQETKGKYPAMQFSSFLFNAVHYIGPIVCRQILRLDRL